jgi:acetoin utilization protein AcuB
MKVTQFMTPKVISAHPGDGIRKTFFKMRTENVRHMPVVDDDGKLVGIISDRDLRRPDWVDEAPDLSHMYKLDDDLTVRDLMTTQVVVVHTYDTIRKATRLLVVHRFGALPVLDKEGTLVGILSAQDLLRAFEMLLE